MFPKRRGCMLGSSKKASITDDYRTLEGWRFYVGIENKAPIAKKTMARCIRKFEGQQGLLR